MLRLRITETTGAPVHAVALRCQIRIEPQRRRYTATKRHAWSSCSASTPQWGDSLRPFLWTHVATTVTGFEGATEVDLPVACTYDFEVAAHQVPPRARGRRDPARAAVLRHGLHAADEAGFAAEPVAVARGSVVPAAGAVWRDMMDLYFPNSGWLRVGRETLDALQRFKAERALPTWDHVSSSCSRKPGRKAHDHDVPTPSGVDRFAAARAVADAVLYEGYVLYPYRASARKNQLRWQFGVLGPAGVRRGRRLRAIVAAAPSASSIPAPTRG